MWPRSREKEGEQKATIFFCRVFPSIPTRFLRISPHPCSNRSLVEEINKTTCIDDKCCLGMRFGRNVLLEGNSGSAAALWWASVSCFVGSDRVVVIVVVVM